MRGRAPLWVLFIGLASHCWVRGDDKVSRVQLAAAVEKAAQAAQMIERMNAKMLEMESNMAKRTAAQEAEARELKKQLAAQATELGQLKATGREIRRRTEAVDCDAVVEGIKDPHLSFARGGRADFRGRNGLMYCFHSAPFFAINIKTEDATFALHDGRLTVDGSFITEAHFIAKGRKEGELVHAVFRANELNEFNTGRNMITGLCGERNFFLGPGRSYSCGTLTVETKHSSATFTTPEWQATARGNFAYGRIAGPEHRIDLSLRATAPVTLGQTHGLVGQSFSSSGPRNGKRDVYPTEGRFRTSAMAEGAIEGAAKDYELPSGDSVEFAFSRFYSKRPAAGGLLLAAGEASTVDDGDDKGGGPGAEAAFGYPARHLSEVDCDSDGTPDSPGGWELAMNIHSSDGHGSGAYGGTSPYAGQIAAGKFTYWDSDIAYSDAKGALKADYKDQTVFQKTANHMAIVRHQDGACEAYKTWAFALGHTGKDLLDHFQNDYRTKVTSGGPVKEFIPTSLSNKEKDPIFWQSGGDVYFNFYYDTNMARIALDGQYLELENDNHDKTQGLGMHYCTNHVNSAQAGTQESCDYWFDVATMITPTGPNTVPASGACASGTDHGVDICEDVFLGQYAIYISSAHQASTSAPPGC